MSIITWKKIATASIALLAATQLVGCGGGDSPAADSGSSGGNGGTGGGGGGGGTTSNTGIFLDSPVQGLKYTTSPSNLTGTTNAAGEYSYRTGDTVTFAVGDLVLGTVTAQGTVTPLTVAQALTATTSSDLETTTINLLAFLQSLDADGNADNGITVATVVANAMTTNAISFTANESTFTSSLTTLVTNVASSTNTTLTVVSREDAADHFAEQTPALVAGTYVWSSATGVPVTRDTRTLTLFENGTYLYGGHDSDPNCNGTGNDEDVNGNGVEMGTFEFNALTSEVSFHKTFETNGGCGPDNADIESYSLEIDENILHLDDGEELSHWVAVPSTVGQLAGSWGIPSALLNNRPLVVSFFPSASTPGTGRYFLVDAMLESPDVTDDASSGIEEGCYTVGSGGALTADLSSGCPAAIDTNDTAGLSNPHNQAYVEVDEHGRLRFSEGAIGDEETITTDFVRLPLQAFATNDRMGTWYIDNGVEPQNDSNLLVASFFADGNYLLGGVHDDNSCDVAGAYQDANGNGAEFGTLTDVEDGFYGSVTPSVLVDTNGECGFYDPNQTLAQRYMFVRSLQTNTLLLFPYDESFGIPIKRVPSVANSVVGAWLMDGLDAAHPHLGVFLPDGVMFEISAAAGDESGLWRSEYAVNGAEFTLISDTALCIDTMGFDSCPSPEQDEVLDFELDGTSMVLSYGEGEEYEEYAYTKITQ